MEKEPKNPEEKKDDDDSEDESDSNSSKNSKKSVYKKSELSQKKATFFRTSKPEKTETTKSVPEENKTVDSDKETELENLEESGDLTEEEAHEVVLSVVDTRMQEVGEELENAPVDSEEEFVAMSSAIFLESLAETANSDQDITPEDVETVYAEAIEDISLEEAETADTSDGAEPPDGGEGGGPPPEDVGGPPEPDGMGEPPELPVFPVATPINIGRGERATVSTTSIPETPDEYEAYIPRSDMLLGVMVGYIIGRRGGRIRTEKRLKPEIKKLENQVAELINTIFQKEKLIRKQSQEIYEKSFSVANKTTAVIERRKVRAQVKEHLKRREELLNDPGVEKIGKFSLPALKVFHERRLPDGNENSPKRVQVEIMTTVQLLEKVDDLKIDSLSVVGMFDRNRLSVEALRQITKEYLRGGEYKKTFYRELGPDLERAESLRQEVSQKHELRQGSNQENEVDSAISESSNNQQPKFLTVEKKLASKPRTKPENKAFKLSVVVSVLVALLVIYLLLG